MKKSLTVFQLSIICAGVFLIPLGIYFWRFKGEPISENPSDWTSFAGYLGDILAPVLSVINIAVFYYLALKVEGLEESRREADQDVEARRRMSDFRFNAYQEIFNLILETIDFATNVSEKSSILKIRFKYILESYQNLFVALNPTLIADLVSKFNKFETLGKEDKLDFIKELNELRKGLILELSVGQPI